MEDKRLYLLAQLDEKTSQKLADIDHVLTQANFVGSQTKNIPYHVTLGSYNLSCLEQVAERLGEVCQRHQPIDLRLSHLGLFGLRVLFAAANINFEIMNLQREFFPECVHGDHPWSAHITILIDEPEEIQRALPIVADLFTPMHARIERVGLYEFFPARFLEERELGRQKARF